jgi:hypothetical protein
LGAGGSVFCFEFSTDADFFTDFFTISAYFVACDAGRGGKST